MAGQAVRRACTHVQGRRWLPGCAREQGRGDRVAQGHSPGHGRVLWWRRVASKPEKTMNMMSMEELTGKEKTKLGKASNGHGVEKRKTRRRRGRRGLPSSGGGCRRERTRWPEKLAEEFAGNLAVENFGVRSTGLRVAARKTGCTSGILASRATPAYIHEGLGDFGKRRYFGELLIFGIK